MAIKKCQDSSKPHRERGLTDVFSVCWEEVNGFINRRRLLGLFDNGGSRGEARAGQLDCSLRAAVGIPSAGTQKEPKSVSLNYRGDGYLLNLYEF